MGEARDHRERHDRRLQSLVGVGDRELHANDVVHERGQERLGVRVADVEADHLAAPGLVHGVRDHKALAYNLRAVADLVDLTRLKLWDEDAGRMVTFEDARTSRSTA